MVILARVRFRRGLACGRTRLSRFLACGRTLIFRLRERGPVLAYTTFCLLGFVVLHGIRPL